MNKWQRWKGIMKCYPFEEKRLNKWPRPFIVQPKYDGVRCRAIPIDNGYILVSSEENLIHSVPHINEALEKQFSLGCINRPELDGELYCHGLSFERIISITSRERNIHPSFQDIHFHCFDIIDEHASQMHRTAGLSAITFRTPLHSVPFWLCDNLDKVTKAYDDLISLGYEGIIVRHIYGPYERKRSTYVMKFKPKQEDNYVITAVQEEIDIEGIPKGSLGAITCLSGDGNLFNIGSGFSSEQRQVLWEDREQLVGKVAKVKYQHLTVGKKVPRFPVFVEVINEKVC